MRFIEKILQRLLLDNKVDEISQHKMERDIHLAARAIEEYIFEESRLISLHREEIIRALDRSDGYMLERIIRIDQELSEIRKILKLHRDNGPECRFKAGDASNDIMQLITTGGPSLLAEYNGKKQIDKTLAEWLEPAKEVICIDPYLFKRSQSGTETQEEVIAKDNDYADQLLGVLGERKQVQFIYRGDRSKGKSALKVLPNVANRVEAQIPLRNIKATFRVVEDLHDRVWLMRDARNKWHAKVVGTSRDGIGKRPTYLIDMSSDDCTAYRSYVDYLIGVSQVSHERPINFKEVRA
ncbi:hypothetical protein PWG14_08365 (plasmid) [Chromobacterium amazonense]|uniref:hypothetical protein n=1 Tax=Chromobacterium amazonense TaxID=1382803 RepID=UPI00237E61B3|nr:hypothetical protein [Chromobacterium amazonense]MDE1712698.1 hypothetical protein [Chromobacterium amazonense]